MTYIHYPFLKRENIITVFRNRIYYFPYRKLIRVIDPEHKIFCANSKYTSIAIKELIGVDPYVLYPPISTSYFNPNRSADTIQRQNTVVTLARIHPGKRLEIIPEIASKTKEDITFQIIGQMDTPEARPFLKSILKKMKELKVSHRIQILTDVNRVYLRELLLASKVYFHPTINEHFGISIVEAMASGCIPVVNDSGGPKETVPQNLRYKSIDEAVTIIEKAVLDWTPNYSSRMVSLADNFGERQFAQRFMKLFDLACEYKSKR